MMAISAGDAATIADYVMLHAGTTAAASNTATTALWIRSHWGAVGNDAAIIALYGEARSDADLVAWAAGLRINLGST